VRREATTRRGSSRSAYGIFASNCRLTRADALSRRSDLNDGRAVARNLQQRGTTIGDVLVTAVLGGADT